MLLAYYDRAILLSMKNTTLIGLVGYKGSGKSALAQQLQSYFGVNNVSIVEYSDAVIALANTLRSQAITTKAEWISAVQNEVNVFNDKQQFDHHELDVYLKITNKTERIDQTNKEQYRPLRAWLGGYVAVALDPGFWDRQVEQMITQAQVSSPRLILVGGVRFESNVALIHKMSGAVWRVVRPGVEEATNATTENRVAALATDAQLINDGDLKDLLHSGLTLLQINLTTSK